MSRRRISRLLRGRFWLLALPPCLWVIWMVFSFHGLTSPEALDYAQQARHLARGEGFITSAIVPLSLAYVPHAVNHPTLFNAPLFPLWEALWFRISGIRESIAALATGTAWMALFWLIFGLSSWLFQREVAFFACALFVVNVTALRFSVSGLPHLLTAVLLTGLVWALAGPHGGQRAGMDAEHKTAFTVVPWRWLCGSAVFAGLTVLCDIHLVWPVFITVFLYWARWPRREGLLPPISDHVPPFFKVGRYVRYRWHQLRHWPALHAALIFTTLFLLVIAPWIIRNARVTGHPCLSMDRFEWLAGTGTYPGQSVYRFSQTWLPSGIVFAGEHPLQMARKGGQSLGFAGQEMAGLAGFVILGLFLVGCLRAPKDESRRPQRYFLLGLFLHLGLLSFASQRYDLLLPFVPGMTVFATATAYRLAIRPAFEWEAQLIHPWWLQRRFLPLWAVFMLTVLPLIATLTGSHQTPVLASSANISYLAQHLPENALVMTDAPWFVAWFADRPSIWLVQDADDLPLLEQKTRSISCLYFTKYRTQIGPNELPSWAPTALLSPSGYHGFKPTYSYTEGEALLIRGLNGATKPRSVQSAP